MSTDSDTYQNKPEAKLDIRKEALVQEFKSLPMAGSVDQFFDTIESWGLPVIAMLGTSRSGKTCLLETFPPEKVSSGHDTLSEVTRDFVNRRGLRLKGNEAVGSLASVHFNSDDNVPTPLLAYARTNSLPDPKQNWRAWSQECSAMLLMRSRLYGRLEDIEIEDIDSSNSTQFLVAHRCCFDRAPGHPFILLDLPGELMVNARGNIADAALRRLPGVVTAAIFVESFMTLYPESEELLFHFRDMTMTSSEVGEVFGLPELHDYGSFRNSIMWWNAFGRTWNQFSSVPTPLLSVITKFDYLQNSDALNIEYTGSIPGQSTALKAFLNKKDAFIGNLNSNVHSDAPLSEFNRLFREFLLTSTQLIGAFGEKTELLLWAGLLKQASQKPMALAHSALLSHVPVQCQVRKPDMSFDLCDHGAAMVRWWIFDRVFSWYESREGLFG